MKSTDFATVIQHADDAVEGVPTLKALLDRLGSPDITATKGHGNWTNHSNYYKYTSSKHTFMCCGWTDWAEHKNWTP
jgi:hypothetical protein